MRYFMTGPEGEKFYGFWTVTSVQEPTSFTFEDSFAADDSYAPAEGLPVSRNVYTFTATEQGTRAVYTTTFESAEALQQVLEMGMEEGSTQAIGQIDALLAS